MGKVLSFFRFPAFLKKAGSQNPGYAASGNTNKSVAGELFISERPVDRHVSNIFNKLGVSSQLEATAFAIKNKILDNDL
jgi:FixJ family two-component response regulator